MCYHVQIFFSNFNPTKCVVMRISHNKDKRSTRYNISGTELRNVSNDKDLGVFMASKTAKSVFEALVSAKIDASEIACLQRKMNGEVIATFKSISAKEKFLRLNSLQVDTEHFALQDVHNPLSFLTIYDAPFELSNLAIIKRLAPYCEVLHYRHGKHSLAPNIYIGLHHYRVRISKPIPSFLRFGKYQIFVKHNSQVPTCRQCNCPGRFSNVCPNRVCLTVSVSATRPVIVVLFNGFSKDEQEDVAVESDDDDGLSNCSYGRREDYLLPASPLTSETSPPADVPADEISSLHDAVLSDSSDSPSVSLPDSPILNSDGLLNSVEPVPDPLRYQIPALLSDSLLTASRRSSSPVAAKPMPPPPSQPVADPPSLSLYPLDTGMDVTVDLKRKLATCYYPP